MTVVHSDMDNCMGYGNCVLGAEDYFDEVDGVVTVLREQVDDADLQRVGEAVAACPVAALRLDRT